MANARYLAESVNSPFVDTFLVDDTYHVLTLDKRRNDVANRVATFFESIAAEDELPEKQVLP